jgi:hypothetical protein
MKVRLRITKANAPVYEGIYDVSDAESFGRACADAWWKLKQRHTEKESSIGALMEHLERDVLDQLHEAHITLERV